MFTDDLLFGSRHLPENCVTFCLDAADIARGTHSANPGRWWNLSPVGAFLEKNASGDVDVNGLFLE
jgi:hypothetical protein